MNATGIASFVGWSRLLWAIFLIFLIFGLKGLESAYGNSCMYRIGHGIGKAAYYTTMSPVIAFAATGKAISKAAKKTGAVVASASKKTAQAVKGAAVHTGKAFKKGGQAVASGSAKAAQATKKAAQHVGSSIAQGTKKFFGHIKAGGAGFFRGIKHGFSR